MQLVSSKIWTRVAVSISYKDNHYTTGTSKPAMHQAPERSKKLNSEYVCHNVVQS